MSIGHQISTSDLAPARVDVMAGSAFTLLVGLAGASAASGRNELDTELRAALDAVGDRVGETWLNLLGAPIDIGPPYDASRLVDGIAGMDPVELRRHLLGKYAWSWCTLAGEDTIERAASGDAVAGRALLGQTRYYGGHALASLSVLVPLDPVETKQRLATAIATAARSLAAREGLEDEIERAAADASAALDTALLGEAIERVTQGYRYVPEPEAERVLLIPHVEPEPWLALAQHRSTRLILFRARPSEGLAERATALGRALADPKRVEILTLLARGTDRVSGLVTVTGLTRSTVHHHLSQLREAGLVELEGNARAYRYAVAGDALPETVALLSDLLAAPGGETG